MIHVQVLVLSACKDYQSTFQIQPITLCRPRTRKKRKSVAGRLAARNGNIEVCLASRQTAPNEQGNLGSTRWQSGATDPLNHPQSPSRFNSSSRWSAEQGAFGSINYETPRETISDCSPTTASRHSTAHDLGVTATYLGRSQYLAHGIPLDEASARLYQTSKDKEASAIDMQTAQLWKAYEIPARAARQSLIDTFMQRCYPWTPILNLQDLETQPDKPASLLLNQAVFLAASRVSSAPGIKSYASSEQFYQRAKVLFWLGYEKNPLIVIAATIMMHWYNPDGPEHVSFDTSKFWLQIGVGLAQQVGLHKEPSRGPDYIARRRLWWSLVVSNPGAEVNLAFALIIL